MGLKTGRCREKPDTELTITQDAIGRTFQNGQNYPMGRNRRREVTRGRRGDRLGRRGTVRGDENVLCCDGVQVTWASVCQSGHIRVHLSKDQVQVPLKAFRPVLVGAPEVGVSLEVGECCLKMCQERGQGEGPATRGPLGPLSSFSSFPPVQKLLDPTRLPEQHSSSLSP